MGMKSCVTLKAGIEIYGYYLYFQWLKAYMGEYLAHLKELSQEEWLNIDFLWAIAESLNLVAATQRLPPPWQLIWKTQEHMRTVRECVRETEKEL